jgi:hypothetical protein
MLCPQLLPPGASPDSHQRQCVYRAAIALRPLHQNTPHDPLKTYAETYAYLLSVDDTWLIRGYQKLRRENQKLR